MREIDVEAKRRAKQHRAMQPGLTSLQTLNRDGLGKDYGNKRTIGLRISAKNPSEMHLFETVAMETEKTLHTLRKIELFFIL